MTDEQTYTIGELAETAGVTARTIRYYTTEGLLPPPDTQGKYARYSVDHWNRLALIARLKDAYLPLHEIRQQIAKLSPAQVVAMLGEVAAPTPLAEASSAEEYIADVVARQRVLRDASAEAGPQLYAPPPARAAGMVAAPPPSAPAAPAEPARAGGFFKRLMPQRRQEQPAGPAPTGEAWRRLTLAPGVELHMREPTDVASQQRIQHLLDYARTVFSSDEQT